MYKSQNDKLRLIKEGLLILGIDIAKKLHWAQPTLHNGILVDKPFGIYNNKKSFESLLDRINDLKQANSCINVIVGLEPTGHYWKPLSWFLIQNGITVVLVNPYHVKQSKEMDDNTQTKNDRKDAGVIARLVRDGRFSSVYFPKDEYAELRVLTTTRAQLNVKLNVAINIVTATLDEYFPEFQGVFKNLTGKVSLHLLMNYPSPQDILNLGVDGMINEFRKVVKRTIGRKKAEALYEAAACSIGLPFNSAVKIKITLHIQELKCLVEQIAFIEAAMAEQLKATGLSQYLLCIKGIGIVTAASFLGEIGNPNRFVCWKQLRKLAGLNLVETSSGQHQGRRVISKRGRASLRRTLYQITMVMITQNVEFKELYTYLRTRPVNPLKTKQAMMAVAVKILRVFFTILTKKEHYDPDKVLGSYRLAQMKAA